MYFATPSTAQIRAFMRQGMLGMIDTPAQGNLLPKDIQWAADNGKFGSGWPGLAAWHAFLAARSHAAGRCWFAVAPDVPFDAKATLAESLPLMDGIRALGYPAALAAQNGLEDLTVPWDTFDVLFLGGDTAWKLGPAAKDLAEQAKALGKRVHMGRVNSLRRLEYARYIGCDSADGTYLAFGPDENLPKLLGWLRKANGQGLLFGGAA
jgi:hypothetical protein